jgi:hypothetical protein
MMRKWDTVRHPEVGLGLLLMLVGLTAPVIVAAADIALPLMTLMTTDGIALVVLPWSPRL